MSQSINQSVMSSPSSFALDHLSPSEQLCYVHCNFCNTVLAVSVPCSSLFKTVTVRCGHCTNLLSVNMRALLLPSTNQLHLSHPLFSPSHNLPEESSQTSLVIDPPNSNDSTAPSVERVGRDDELPRTPANRPPEKRQRVPSAYNRFIKEEIQRIKAGNPEITHREAFSTAAKNWAHFPHIHFGLMTDQNMKKTAGLQQDGEDVITKDGFFATANMGVTPY